MLLLPYDTRILTRILKMLRWQKIWVTLLSHQTHPQMMWILLFQAITTHPFSLRSSTPLWVLFHLVTKLTQDIVSFKTSVIHFINLCNLETCMLCSSSLAHIFIDSKTIVELQDMIYKFKRSIQKERYRSANLADKVSHLEIEKVQLRRSLEEIKDHRSGLELNQVELENEVRNLK